MTIVLILRREGQHLVLAVILLPFRKWFQFGYLR